VAQAWKVVQRESVLLRRAAGGPAWRPMCRSGPPTSCAAVKAWLAFERAVSRIGYIKSVDFDDPTINATVRALGGWEAVCGMPANEFDTFLQKRFQDTYCALARSGISAEQAEPLLGWADKQNGVLGYNAAPPVRIATGLPSLPAPQPAKAIPAQRPADMPLLKLKRA
jgi:hypothetical protein